MSDATWLEGEEGSEGKKRTAGTCSGNGDGLPKHGIMRYGVLEVELPYFGLNGNLVLRCGYGRQSVELLCVVARIIPRSKCKSVELFFGWIEGLLNHSEL